MALLPFSTATPKILVGNSGKIQKQQNIFKKPRFTAELKPYKMQSFDVEINEQMRHEQSRTVKICMLKYKCIMLFTFLALALFQMIYILVDKLSTNQAFSEQLFRFLNSTYHRSSQSTNVVLDNNHTMD
jgi:hypothetical protein